MNYKELIKKLANKKNLTIGEAQFLFRKIMNSEYNDEQISTILLGLADKGEVSDEITGGASILREKSSKIWITTNMIIGLPGETLDSLEETLQWLKKQKIVDEMMANILTVPSFIEELDSIIDFSNMTKNPEKFGFTRLEYFPKFYWEHDTMNLRQSVEVKNHWRKELNNHTFTRFGGSARTFG